MGQTAEFWENPGIVQYFGDRPPESYIVDFLNQHPAGPNQTALDLGCGAGRHTEMLVELGYATSAIDPYPAMLAATRARLAAKDLQADIREGSITDIPYPDANFDRIVTTGVLHQARSTREYGTAIGELARVARLGAYVSVEVFTNPLSDSSFEPVSADGLTVRTREGLLMTLLPHQLLSDMMQERGLSLVHAQPEETIAENTGPRTIIRAFFQKQ